MTDNLRTLTVEGHTTSTAHRLMHYDGVCGNVHGHNIEWNAELQVKVPDTDDQMAVDFKDVTDVFDRYDHALLVNEKDPLFEVLDNVASTVEGHKCHSTMLGDIYQFESDPTMEHVAGRIARELVEEFERIERCTLQIHETGKYGVEHSYPGVQL